MSYPHNSRCEGYLPGVQALYEAGNPSDHYPHDEAGLVASGASLTRTEVSLMVSGARFA